MKNISRPDFDNHSIKNDPLETTGKAAGEKKQPLPQEQTDGVRISRSALNEPPETEKKVLIHLKNIRENLETRLENFIFSLPSPAVVKQIASFAAATIWDLLKKANYEIEEDEEISAQLLAMLLQVHSKYTFEHSERVMEWTLSMAEKLGINNGKTLESLGKSAFFRDIGMIGSSLFELSEKDRADIGRFLCDSVESLRACGSLHDIGKITIPKRILNKATSLTDEEYDIIKTHPLIGVEIVKPDPTLRDAIPGIMHHHERWDGKGYPDGLKGEEIPLQARIITITDSFDAMTEDRPYRKGLSYKYALQELISKSGTQFDPNLTPVFIRALYDSGEITSADLDKELNLDLLRLEMKTNMQ